eukprot:8197599-Prorocentrum_lima.AAC.1
MTSSLVGSEMCIRDSIILKQLCACSMSAGQIASCPRTERDWFLLRTKGCLLYTSDAADDM